MRSYLLGLFACLLTGSVSAQDIQTIERPMIIVELRGEAPGHAPEIVIALDHVELLRTTVSPQWQEIVARLPDGYESAVAVSVEHVMPPCSANGLYCDAIQAEVFLRDASFAGESLRPSNETIARSGDLLPPGDTRYFLRGMQFSGTDRTGDGIAYIEGLLREPELAEPCAGGSAECTNNADPTFLPGQDLDCDLEIVGGEHDEVEYRRRNALLAARMSVLQEVNEAEQDYENLKYDLWDEYPEDDDPYMEGVPQFLEHMPVDIDAASLSDLRDGLAHLRRLSTLPPADHEGGGIVGTDILTAIAWHERFIAALERIQSAEERMSDLRAAMSCD